VSVFTSDRNASFHRKLEFWKKYVEKGQYGRFQTLNDVLIETKSSLEETIYGSIVQHLIDLRQAIQKYFPSSTDDAAWARNPYCASEKPNGMCVQNYDCLMDITFDLA
jgi:hypothetical protein